MTPAGEGPGCIVKFFLQVVWLVIRVRGSLHRGGLLRNRTTLSQVLSRAGGISAQNSNSAGAFMVDSPGRTPLSQVLSTAGGISAQSSDPAGAFMVDLPRGKTHAFVLSSGL